MQREFLSLDALPTWCSFNSVTFQDVEAADIEGKGNGLVATKDLMHDETGKEPSVLLRIPRELVLSREGVEQFAKENQAFRLLIDVAGHQSNRGDILLFLLFHLVSSSHLAQHSSISAKTAWTQYFKFLPQSVPLPTTWSEPELFLLRGTSLESSVKAKLASMTREFDTLKAKVTTIPFWNETLCVDELITIHDWVLLDALYRSRSLELPRSGESMVPCLDLANHSTTYTARFDETTDTDEEVVLVLREGAHLKTGDEVTISYGSQKSAAEMLFSYGFIEPQSPAHSLTLPLNEIFDDEDPLLKAKLFMYKTPPTLTLTEDNHSSNESGGLPTWSAPFAYLMCVNEEDGLDFKILQQTNGTQEMRMFWLNQDITPQINTSHSFHEIIANHKEMAKVFELRVVTTILGLLEAQLARLEQYAPLEGDQGKSALRAEVWMPGVELRRAERDLMSRAVKRLERERDMLFEDESVLAYLAANAPPDAEDGGDDDEDYS